MAMGFLAHVDYRLYCDNIDWKALPRLTGKAMSIRDLNKIIFLPQRDEAAVAEIKKASASLKSPRIAVFSPSIEHARRFASTLVVNGIPCLPISGEDRVERQRRLMDFAAGRLTAITAVDLLNEGIDVPEINILVFMRATHSRRIFIQQLGRGLRLAPEKESVIVLDFVSDLRRMAEVVDMDTEARSKGRELQNVYLQNGIVHFSNQAAVSFIEAWLKDVADLSSSSEMEKLTFPGIVNGQLA
jgi:superfamily II DNA or RNA helicase